MRTNKMTLTAYRSSPDLSTTSRRAMGLGQKAKAYRSQPTLLRTPAMTASPQIDFLRSLCKERSERLGTDSQKLVPILQSMFDDWHQPTLDPDRVNYESGRIADIDATWVHPLDADEGKLLLYTHSGGFAVGALSSHQKLAAHVAKALGATAVIIDFRRTPEHPFSAQIDDATTVYKTLLERGYAPENITIVGDSIGGNLALSSVLNLRALGLPLPGGVIVLSPWLDSEQQDGAPLTETLPEATSPIFFGSNGSPADPLENPLHADYRGFPRLYINAGAVELLLDNSLLDGAQRLHARALCDGVDSHLSVVEGMRHAFPFLASHVHEAEDELRRIAHWFGDAQDTSKRQTG